MKKFTKRITASQADNSTVTWDELSKEQQDYVVDNYWHFSAAADWIYEAANISARDEYEYRLTELIATYETDFPGLQINKDKIYWDSNSQGWYPEWEVNDIFHGSDVELDDRKFVFPVVDIETSDYRRRRYGYEAVEIVLEDVFYSDIENRLNETGSWTDAPWEEIKENLDVYFKDLNEPFTQADVEYIDSYVDGIKNFYDDLCNLISDYMDYFDLPDDKEFIRGALDGASFVYELDDDGEVVDIL